MHSTGSQDSSTNKPTGTQALPTDLGAFPEAVGSGRGRSHGTSSKAPFDRWFRYPAGFATDYVSLLLDQLELPSQSLIVDPFAGSGVTGTAARNNGLRFLGIEAHPLIAELAQLKLQRPPAPPDDLLRASAELVGLVRETIDSGVAVSLDSEPELVRQCFTEPVLAELVTLRSLVKNDASVWAPYLKWAVLGTLRDVASARVGWPYQRPAEQRQPRYKSALARFESRASLIAGDLLRSEPEEAEGIVVCGDSRQAQMWNTVPPEGAQGCVSSPPYLNNFDYADATRLELYFWGAATSWSEMCASVRAEMITATTQQSSVPALREAVEGLSAFATAKQIMSLTQELEDQRKLRKRGKEYDRVVPDYFLAIAQVLERMAAALERGAPIVWLVGDSAPYGVYIDTPRLIGELASEIGLVMEKDVLLRHRGKRWGGNSVRHNVELSERLILLRKSDF
ncbi:DNA methyltransferase [Actinomadura sp. NPDC023710]|uniref:DNA methyltransferase n=1 Tax=Actinomadura sp. NPDC023710 TaxID=3158219 RepID=UPI0033EDEBEC